MDLLFLFKIFNQFNALLHAPVQPVVLQALGSFLMFCLWLFSVTTSYPVSLPAV